MWPKALCATVLAIWPMLAMGYPIRMLVAGGPDASAPDGYAGLAPGPAGAEASVLFVMQAANLTATPVPGQAKNFTLTLAGVQPGVVAFADAPVRFAATIGAPYFIRSPRFLLNGAWLNNPNVAVMGHTSKNSSRSVITVLTLFDTKLDATNTTLTATGRIVEGPKDLATPKVSPEITFALSNPEAVKRRPDLSATAPTVLQGVTFFIDNLVGFGNDFVGGFLDFGL